MTARIHCRDYAQSASRVIESEIAHQRAEVRAGRSKARAVAIVRRKLGSVRNSYFNTCLRVGADGDPIDAWDERGPDAAVTALMVELGLISAPPTVASRGLVGRVGR